MDPNSRKRTAGTLQPGHRSAPWRLHRWKLLTLTLACCAASASAPGASTARSIDEVLAGIARNVSESTAFIERRESKLLSAPLTLTGRLQRLDGGTLVRHVETPYREVSRVSNRRVIVERDGRRRSFALARAPELADALRALDAVLQGDRAAIERRHRIEMKNLAERWTLILRPRVAGRDFELHAHGVEGEVLCVVVRNDGIESSRMLVGTAASSVAGGNDFDSQCADAGG